MKKLGLLILFLFCFGLNPIKASEESLEKIFLDGGYTELNVALQESEDFFQQEITLPTRLPPVAFTHHFGRFSTLGGPQLEITYLHEDYGETHYKILVTALTDKQNFRDDQTVKLNDGNEAVYHTSENFDVLAFEKNGLQYMLMVDKLHPKIFTINALVDIANSTK